MNNEEEDKKPKEKKTQRRQPKPTAAQAAQRGLKKNASNSENSLKNLKPLGALGIAGPGRPKGPNLKTRLERELSRNVIVVYDDGTQEEREVIDDIIIRLVKKARDGNMLAIQEVLDRYYGKEVQKHEHEVKHKIEEEKKLLSVYEKLDKAFGLKPDEAVIEGQIIEGSTDVIEGTNSETEPQNS